MLSKRHKTQQQSQTIQKDDNKLDFLQKIISLASQQKLLPKFVYQMDVKCGNGRKKRFIEYQKIVKSIYGQEGKIPLKYDEEEAMSDQQKIRKKIIQLQNNELEIDYFERIRTKDGIIVPHFKGHHMEKVTYPTKKQFLIFNDFNEKKFLKSYSNIFQDKLQLRQTSLFRKQRMKTVAVIPENTRQQQLPSSTPNPKFNKFSVDERKDKEKGLNKVKKIKLRPLTESIQVLEKSQRLLPFSKQHNEKYKPHIEKTKIGRCIKEMQKQVLYQKMLLIGSYQRSVSQKFITLTRQSLAKYLKSLYERQMRIIDFLEVKPTFTLPEYTALCTKLKLMQVEHIIFLTFLFYDFNNDGYICENDIRRIRNLVEGKKNKVIAEDLKLIEAIKERKDYEAKVLFQQYGNKKYEEADKESKESTYLQLYKLPEITQSTYFNWLNKNNEKNPSKIQEEEIKISENHQATQQPYEQQCTQRPPKKSSTNLNPFNPSVLKFKHNYFQQNAQVRKYIMGIKSNKVYITFQEFKSKYENRQESHYQHMNHSQQSRSIIHNSKVTKALSKQENGIGLSRYGDDNKQRRSERVLEAPKKNNNSRFRYQESMAKPFLWYDLIERLAGVRFQGVRYG